MALSRELAAMVAAGLLTAEQAQLAQAAINSRQQRNEPERSLEDTLRIVLGAQLSADLEDVLDDIEAKRETDYRGMAAGLAALLIPGLMRAVMQSAAREAALQAATRVADQTARDHAADLLHELGIHLGDTILLNEHAGRAVATGRALLVDAAAFLWQGDDIPELAERVGITLTVRVILPKSGQPSRRDHRRVMWLPPSPRGLRIAGPEFQERNP